MRAVTYTEHGPAAEVLRLGERPDPVAGPGEVLVRIHYSGVNPSDVKRRSGLRERSPFPLVIPHNDGSGVIEAVGPGVDAARIGERVWVYNGHRGGRAFGTCAELMAVAGTQAVRLPDNVPLEAGACLGVPAMTAWYSLFADGDLAGRDVLVTGGAGAVGHYAVQLARLAGARTVITTVSSAEKAAHAARANPTHIVNYRDEDVAKRVMEITGGRGVTRISEVDLGGNIAASLAVAGPKTVIGAYAAGADPEPRIPFGAMIGRDMVLRAIFCSLMEAPLRAEGTRRLAEWMAAGRVVHSIAHVLPLEEAARAHEMVESGTVIGKVVLKLA